MTEITFDIYGNEAEIVSYQAGATELYVKFTTPIEGFLNLAGKIFTISNGSCIFKLHSINDGEYKPQVITHTGFIRLPRLIKDGKTIFPAPLDDEYTRSLSKRERQLEARVKELEATVKDLMKSVYETTLFN